MFDAVGHPLAGERAAPDTVVIAVLRRIVQALLTQRTECAERLSPRDRFRRRLVVEQIPMTDAASIEPIGHAPQRRPRPRLFRATPPLSQHRRVLRPAQLTPTSVVGVCRVASVLPRRRVGLTADLTILSHRHRVSPRAHITPTRERRVAPVGPVRDRDRGIRAQRLTPVRRVERILDTALPASTAAPVSTHRAVRRLRVHTRRGQKGSSSKSYCALRAACAVARARPDGSGASPRRVAFVTTAV